MNDEEFLAEFGMSYKDACELVYNAQTSTEEKWQQLLKTYCPPSSELHPMDILKLKQKKLKTKLLLKRLGYVT